MSIQCKYLLIIFLSVISIEPNFSHFYHFENIVFAGTEKRKVTKKKSKRNKQKLTPDQRVEFVKAADLIVDPHLQDPLSPAVINKFFNGFNKHIVESVLSEGGRRDNATVTTDESALKILIDTAPNARVKNREDFIKSKVSTVEIILTKNIPVDSLGKRVAYSVKTSPNRLAATVYIHPDWIRGLSSVDISENGNVVEKRIDTITKNEKLLQGLVRSAFVGDRLIHPHIRKSKSTEVRSPSYVQVETFYALNDVLTMSADDDLEGETRPMRVALQAPGGIGKTFSIAHWVSKLAKYTKNGNERSYTPTKFVFCVQNKDVLADAKGSFRQEFNASEDEVIKLYSNPNAKKDLEQLHRNASTDQELSPDAKGILVTRSTMYNRIEDIMAWAEGQKVVFVFDEGHHVASGEEKQFHDIFQNLNKLEQNPDDPDHLIVSMSATLFSGNNNIIINPEYFGSRNEARGKVTGMFLTPDQLDQLQRGEDVPLLSIKQWMKAQILGYAPVAVLSSKKAVDDHGETILLSKVVRDRENNTREVYIDGKEVEELYYNLIASREPNSKDRGIIAVNGIDRIDELEVKLNLIARIDADMRGLVEPDVEFRGYHSKTIAGGKPNPLPWHRYIHDIDSDKHKYLIVDGMVNEGVDLPTTNIVVIHKDAANIRFVLQIIMRGSRVTDLETSVRVIDYSGIIERYFKNQEEPVLVESSVGLPKAPADGGFTTEIITESSTAVEMLSDDISLIQMQDIRDTDYFESFKKRLVQNSPFYQFKNIKQSLAEVVLSFVSKIPHKRIVHSSGEIQIVLNNDVFQRLELKIPLQKHVSSILKAYQDLVRNQHHLDISETEQDKQIYLKEIHDSWFVLLDELKIFDPRAGKSVVLKMSRQPAPIIHKKENTEAVIGFLAEFAQVNNLSVEADGDSLVFAGTNAYALMNEFGGRIEVTRKGGKKGSDAKRLHSKFRLGVSILDGGIGKRNSQPNRRDTVLEFKVNTKQIKIAAPYGEKKQIINLGQAEGDIEESYALIGNAVSTNYWMQLIDQYLDPELSNALIDNP